MLGCTKKLFPLLSDESGGRLLMAVAARPPSWRIPVRDTSGLDPRSKFLDSRNAQQIRRLEGQRKIVGATLSTMMRSGN
jgi:hypothetical protein